MGRLIALPGEDVVAAFVAGGFRVARRERGLALLVRGVQVVVVPETGTLSEIRIRGLLDRAEVAEDELLAWLASSGARPRAKSFDEKGPSKPPRTVRVQEAVKHASDARARADAAHVATKNALESSRALQQSLARWYEAWQELDEREKQAAPTRKR